MFGGPPLSKYGIPIILHTMLYYVIVIREGCTKQNPEKVWSFAKPPPGLAFFPNKKFTPIFFLKIASIMAETNFTLGPTSKINKFPLLIVIIRPELANIK